MLSFEWDSQKDLINQEKHGISFREAKTVFYDENALLEYDENHSESEDRFRILGCSDKGNILLVVHCIRDEDIIRIISARRSTSYEQKEYERSVGS
ncbi:MAG: BrnT family toxin [Eubacterium sp.]|nr:BrnT family toxin [Eubacterium sp.]